GRVRRMEAVGGLVGVSQDPDTLALRPKAGWAVREAETMDVLLARIAEDHTTFPPTPLDRPNGLPEDLCKFYHRTDGAELFGRGPSAAYRVEGVRGLERLDWGEVSESLRDNDYPNGQIWYRLARLADGSWLAINPSPAYPDAVREQFRS